LSFIGILLGFALVVQNNTRKCHEVQSSTTGKAGGLKDPEPLKAVKNLGPPKGAYY